MVLAYIYFTRIVLYLVRMSIPFRYVYLSDLFNEFARAVFFVATGYMFSPVPENRYLHVPSEDPDTLEMDEIIVPG